MELNNRHAARQMMQEKLNGLSRPPVPAAYEFLWQPARFKVCKGGRGKGATWSIGRRLIDKAHTQTSLILCTREVQKSIKDSVHRVLKNQIRQLGYGEFFQITASSIKSLVSGSEFIFHGLNDLSVDDLKSMEGITDVWVAEGEKTSKNSWQTLEPTIRVKGSEIYVDYNPKEELGATNVKFTTECPDDAIVKHINFDQNPYFPEVLEKLRQQDLKKITDAINEDARDQAQLDYNWIWLGHTLKVSKASIFGAKYQVEQFDPNTDAGEWDGPYDGADWGFAADPTVRVRVWIWTKPTGHKWLCIEREEYLKGADGMNLQLRELPQKFDSFPRSREVLIRADNAQPQTIGYMQNAGFRIEGAEKWAGSVEDGIVHMRGAYQGILVHPRCPRTAEEMKLYSYKIDRLTGDVLTDIIDAWNHCIDAIRYAIEPIISLTRGGHLFG